MTRGASKYQGETSKVGTGSTLLIMILSGFPRDGAQALGNFSHIAVQVNTIDLRDDILKVFEDLSAKDKGRTGSRNLLDQPAKIDQC